jgi:hypothetical protein
MEIINIDSSLGFEKLVSDLSVNGKPRFLCQCSYNTGDRRVVGDFRKLLIITVYNRLDCNLNALPKMSGKIESTKQ